MKRLLVALVFLAALGGVLWFAFTQKPVPVAMPASVPDTTSATSSDVQFATKTIAEDTPSYSIKVEYRLFGNPTVDAHVQAEVQKAVDAFKKDAANFDPSVDTNPYAFTGEVGEYYNAPDISSERINLYQDTGGAHGLPIVLALNYDSKTGETITLDRALAMIGKSLPQVAAASLAQLKQAYGDSVFLEGVSATPENYSTFVVSPYSVDFVFQAYQAVPYAAGMPDVKFNRPN